MARDDSSHPAVPKMPERPRSEPEKPRTSPLSFLLAGMLALGVTALAFALWAPIALAIAAGILLIPLIAGFHYFIWGHWLGDAIRQEVAEEEREEQERAQQRRALDR